jgi:hypothetical protein
VDDRTLGILARFESRADVIADEIASCTLAEVDGFRPFRDVRLYEEIRSLAQQHLQAYVQTARSRRSPAPEMLRGARERAAQRAREMVPLAALVHSYLIAQRVISAAIVHDAGTDAESREGALTLIAATFDYNIATVSAMAEAYVDIVQGDLAELESARRGLVEDLLSSEATPFQRSRGWRSASGSTRTAPMWSPWQPSTRPMTRWADIGHGDGLRRQLRVHPVDPNAQRLS